VNGVAVFVGDDARATRATGRNIPFPGRRIIDFSEIGAPVVVGFRASHGGEVIIAGFLIRHLEAAPEIGLLVEVPRQIPIKIVVVDGAFALAVMSPSDFMPSRMLRPSCMKRPPLIELSRARDLAALAA
jgi:hypothetical protein